MNDPIDPIDPIDPVDPVDPENPGNPEHAADPVDALGRLAGEALRRPAPTDGVRRLRTARRRQQVIRAGGAAAIVLVFAGGAFALTRPDDEQITTATTLVTEPPATTAPATTLPSTVPPITPVPTPAPTTTPAIAPSTVPTTVAPPTTVAEAPSIDTSVASDAFAAWTRQQRDAGRIALSRFPGSGTDAVLYGASNIEPGSGRYLPDGATTGSYDAIVLLADGRVAPVPGGTALGGSPALQLVGLGQRVAAIQVSSSSVPVSEPDLLLLDDTTLTWSVGPDLGWSRKPDLFAEAWSVDGSVVIGRWGWGDPDGGELVPGTDGVIVRPDLSVEPMATPPANVQASWTSVSGDLAISFGYYGTGSAFSYPAYPNPWALDVANNEWFEVPNPDWMTCSPDCTWKQPVEGGTPFLEVGTDRGALVRVPDGSIGLFDTAARTWRRMDDVPVEPFIPVTAVVGDRVVVAPRGAPVAGGTASLAVLDLDSGSWTTREFPAAEAGFSWDLRSDGASAMAQTIELDSTVEQLGSVRTDRAAVVAPDGTWRGVTEDAGHWIRFAELIDLRTVDVA